MKNTDALQQTEVTVQGRTFTIHSSGTNVFGRYYILVGSKGAAYLATQAYMNDEHTLKLISDHGHELRIRGNRVLLTNESGELRQKGI